MNAQFCRILLQQAMKDLTGREAEHFRANCSAMKMSGFRGYYLVEWRQASMDNGRTFTLEVQADNVAEAKAKGINHWLEHHAERARTANWPPRDGT
jgi:biotin-(acetyl-CoA carboxylase) ligase